MPFPLWSRCVTTVRGTWLTGASRGFFGHGDMQKEFEQAAFALKPGEVSGVVDTASGVHLIERYVVRRRASCRVTMTLASDLKLET